MGAAPIQLIEVDPLDPAQGNRFAAWAAVFEDSARAGYGDLHTAWTAAEIQAYHRIQATEARRRCWAAVDGDRVLGAAEVQLPLTDNLDWGGVDLAVRPASRRQGVGTALLLRAEAEIRGAGRHVVGIESDQPITAPDPAAGFAARHGYRAEQHELRSDLVLPVSPEHLGPREPSDGYSVLTVWDRIPAAWLTDRAELSRRMSTDVPVGGVEYGEERWDAERVSRTYDLVAAQGRRLVESVARDDATGTLVGYTQVLISAERPALAYQWDTIVLPEHRGHGLGLRLKQANLRALSIHAPQVSRIATWNAEENEPMLRVNRAMGFTVVGRLTEWQKHLA